MRALSSLQSTTCPPRPPAYVAAVQACAVCGMMPHPLVSCEAWLPSLNECAQHTIRSNGYLAVAGLSLEDQRQTKGTCAILDPAQTPTQSVPALHVYSASACCALLQVLSLALQGSSSHEFLSQVSTFLYLQQQRLFMTICHHTPTVWDFRVCLCGASWFTQPCMPLHTFLLMLDMSSCSAVMLVATALQYA